MSQKFTLTNRFVAFALLFSVAIHAAGCASPDINWRAAEDLLDMGDYSGLDDFQFDPEELDRRFAKNNPKQSTEELKRDIARKLDTAAAEVMAEIEVVDNEVNQTSFEADAAGSVEPDPGIANSANPNSTPVAARLIVPDPTLMNQAPKIVDQKPLPLLPLKPVVSAENRTLDIGAVESSPIVLQANAKPAPVQPVIPDAPAQPITPLAETSPIVAAEPEVASESIVATTRREIPDAEGNQLRPACSCGSCADCLSIESALVESDAIVESLMLSAVASDEMPEAPLVLEQPAVPSTPTEPVYEIEPPFALPPVVATDAIDLIDEQVAIESSHLARQQRVEQIDVQVCEVEVCEEVEFDSQDRNEFQTRTAPRLQSFEPVDEGVVAQDTPAAPVSADWQPPSVRQASFAAIEEAVAAKELEIPTPTSATLPEVVSTAVERSQFSPELEMPSVEDLLTLPVQIDSTIAAVRKELGQQPQESREAIGLEVNLRFLEVLRRQLDQTENGIQMDQREQEYWQHQLTALATMLDPAGQPAKSDFTRHRTAMQTLEHMRSAVERLQRIANLKLSRAAFCRSIDGYGQIKRMNVDQVKPGQRMLIYTEVENFVSKQVTSADGQTVFQTRLRGSYAVYDEEGRAVQQAEFPTLVDEAMNHRRDFYMHLPITVGELAPGSYRLHLLVEDLTGNKTAGLDPPMVFTVR